LRSYINDVTLPIAFTLFITKAKVIKIDKKSHNTLWPPPCCCDVIYGQPPREIFRHPIIEQKKVFEVNDWRDFLVQLKCLALCCGSSKSPHWVASFLWAIKTNVDNRHKWTRKKMIVIINHNISLKVNTFLEFHWCKPIFVLQNRMNTSTVLYLLCSVVINELNWT